MENNLIPVTKYEKKLYNNAYNNPSQYDIDKMKDGRLTNLVIQGITDRRKEEANGTFKYKSL